MYKQVHYRDSEVSSDRLDIWKLRDESPDQWEDNG